MADCNTRTSNFSLCSEISAMWIGFKPQIRVYSKCGSKLLGVYTRKECIWKQMCVHAIIMIMCTPASHGRQFSILLTVVKESQMTYATRNSAQDSRTDPLRSMRIAKRKCPRACASSTSTFDVVTTCWNHARRDISDRSGWSTTSVWRVRDNYSSQLSIKGPNVMKYKESNSYSTNGLTLTFNCLMTYIYDVPHR